MKQKHLHCVGIGGIGVSALARLYRARGWQVSGSDIARSEITRALKKEGIRVFIGPHRSSHLTSSVTKVIYTAAAAPGAAAGTEPLKLLYSFHDRRKSTTSAWPRNPEIVEALKRGIPVMSYAQAVGELTREYQTIAVAGAHGKSTTTAMIALMMARTGLDPTVIVGTKLREFGSSNFRLGRSPWLVLEADEYRASLLNYSPSVAVITNLDREHLDFYKNIRNIERTFSKFLLCLKPNGTAILNRDDSRLRRMGLRLKRARRDIRVLWYSLRHPARAKISRVIQIPGKHNISNALAAYTIGKALGVPEKKILTAIGAYRGSWRRFDYQGLFNGAKVFADYAHHPAEIKATLQAAREKFPHSRIWCVFQPHHYERTRDLFSEFVSAFDECDGLILLDIYEVAGREQKQKLKAVSSETLARAISRRGTPALYLPNPEQRLNPFLKQWLRPGDILIMMGAGSIWEMTKDLMNNK